MQYYSVLLLCLCVLGSACQSDTNTSEKAPSQPKPTTAIEAREVVLNQRENAVYTVQDAVPHATHWLIAGTEYDIQRKQQLGVFWLMTTAGALHKFWRAEAFEDKYPNDTESRIFIPQETQKVAVLPDNSFLVAYQTVSQDKKILAHTYLEYYNTSGEKDWSMWLDGGAKANLRDILVTSEGNFLLLENLPTQTYQVDSLTGQKLPVDAIRLTKINPGKVIVWQKVFESRQFPSVLGYQLAETSPLNYTLVGAAGGLSTHQALTYKSFVLRVTADGIWKEFIVYSDDSPMNHAFYDIASLGSRQIQAELIVDAAQPKARLVALDEGLDTLWTSKSIPCAADFSIRVWARGDQAELVLQSPEGQLTSLVVDTLGHVVQHQESPLSEIQLGAVAYDTQLGFIGFGRQDRTLYWFSE